MADAKDMTIGVFCWLVEIKNAAFQLILRLIFYADKMTGEYQITGTADVVARFSTEMMVNLSMRLTMAPSPHPGTLESNGRNAFYVQIVERIAFTACTDCSGACCHRTEATHKIRAMESIQRAKQSND